MGVIENLKVTINNLTSTWKDNYNQLVDSVFISVSKPNSNTLRFTKNNTHTDISLDGTTLENLAGTSGKIGDSIRFNGTNWIGTDASVVNLSTITYSTSGTSTNYTSSFKLYSYQNNIVYLFKSNNSNIGSTFLNINSLGNLKIFKNSNGVLSDLINNDLFANITYGLIYDSLLNSFILLSGGGSSAFTSDIAVSLSSGKTLGRYVTGQTIPSTGKTFEQVMNLIAQEPITPTLTLTTPTTVQFNQTAISNVLNFTRIINSLNATTSTVVLQWRRGGVGAYTALPILLNDITHTHILTDTSYNTAAFNYQYIVTDSIGGTATQSLNITPVAYVAPSATLTQVASTLNGPQTNTSREKGNVSTSLSGSITRNSINVNLISYKLQISVNGGSFIDISGVNSISGGSATILPITHNDVSLAISSTNTIIYRVSVTDGFSTNVYTSSTINFQYLWLYGFSTNSSLSSSQTYALGNGLLLNNRNRTISALTAAPSNFTYLSYVSTFGNISSIIQDGAVPVLGAFTQLGNLTVTNQYNVAITYILYKSNASQAFNNNTLVIT